MGYPMTWQRVMNRNSLNEGGYDKLPLKHQMRVNVDRPGLGTEESLRDAMWPLAVKRLHEYEATMKGLLGDIRRLQVDTCDEGSVCHLIAYKTGLEPDVVAAVLKEFFAT